MEEAQFESLQEGDVLRHKMGSEGYMVCANYGKSGVVVTRTRLISNPDEWDLILKANHGDAQAADRVMADDSDEVVPFERTEN